MINGNTISNQEKRESYRELTYLIYFLISIFLIYIVIWAFTGMWPFTNNNYNSYTLQAKSWLEGRLDLGRDYSYLEIASYGGKYYISFPPFPSYIMLPFVMLFGVHTPDHFIAFISIMIGGFYAFRLAKTLGLTNKSAYFWSLFLLVGTNLLFVSINGWVWFFAQNLAFTLSIGAIYYAVKQKGGISFVLLACSVGCRPFQIIYFPLLIFLLLHGKEEVSLRNIFPLIKKYYKWFIAPFFIGVSYMILNYMRFDNIFEFGHNYLPEFVNAKEGQFSTNYIVQNLRNMFRLPTVTGDYKLLFPKFDGTAFWMVSPIFISYMIYLIYNIIKKKMEMIRLICGITLLLILHMVMLSAHKTLGGWHFGNRYTNDLLPFLYYGLLRMIPKEDELEIIQYPLCLFGLSLNIIGTIAIYNNWF